MINCDVIIIELLRHRCFRHRPCCNDIVTISVGTSFVGISRVGISHVELNPVRICGYRCDPRSYWSTL